MVRYGCDCTVFAKGLVGSNTEVTGKIPVSSQKYEAEKLYRLGKKKIKLHWRLQRSKPIAYG